MNGKEFSYWLKGAFDVSNTKEFTENQTKVIKAHLDLVLSNSQNQNDSFCNWLEGFFDLVQPQKINEENTSKIKQKLDEKINTIDKNKQPHIVPWNDSKIRC